MRRYIPLLFIFALSALILVSCHHERSNIELSKVNRISLLDSFLNATVEHLEISGAVACIIQDNRVIYHKAIGWRNAEQHIAMEVGDIFRIASMTKALTAVAILQLYERGLLSLDDEIGKYISEFKNPQVLIKILPDSGFIARPAKGEITIRQLLTHTSGIGYGFQDEKYNALIMKNDISEGFEDDDRSSLENIQRLAKIPLLFDPGERFTYGLSFDVLGVIIEKISGMRYDQYIVQYILEPLDMSDSHFIIPEEKRYRLVSVCQPAEDGQGIEPSTYPDTIYPVISTRRYFSGGADLCSTAEDYARFMQMILDQGTLNNTRILGKRYISMMLSKQTNLVNGVSYQGFAAEITNSLGAARSPMSRGSFEFGGFFDTHAWADPKERFAAVLLLQMYPNNRHDILQRFKQIVYDVIGD